jgi:hypothetical protein
VGAAGGDGGEDVRLGEGRADRRGYLGGTGQRGQGDRAAAEAAAGHPGAVGAGVKGGVDNGVEFGAGDLEVVAQ